MIIQTALTDKTQTGVVSDGTAEYEEAVAVLKALADPTRLRILNVLMQGESCNCELNDLLAIPPNLLSHHLRVLRRAGLIHSRRDALDGRWIYYGVNKEVIERWQTWLSQFLDPKRLRKRPVLCGPEGQSLLASTVSSPRPCE